MIITSQLLSDAHRYILRCLSTLQGIRSCTVFTSISEVFIHPSIVFEEFYQHFACCLCVTNINCLNQPVGFFSLPKVSGLT